MTDKLTDALLDRLLPAVRRIRDDALAAEDRHAEELVKIEPIHRPSARNLIHYLAVRKHDIRPLQQDLLSVGLSSLGIIEPHALASLNNVIYVLERLKGLEPSAGGDEPVDLRTGSLVLRDNAVALLGPEPGQRAVRIMVTMPGEAASQPQLIEALLRAGMNVMRVNCAHDTPDDWRAMVAHLRDAEKKTNLSCKVQADLAGPKVRTGPIAPAGFARRVRPRRDVLGRVVQPGRIWLHAGEEEMPSECDFEIPVDSKGLAKLRTGDVLGFTDARGRKRRIDVTDVGKAGAVGEIASTAYITTGMKLDIRRGDKAMGKLTAGQLPEVVEPLALETGDELVLTRATEAGMAAHRNRKGEVTAPARIHCTLPEAFDQVKAGEAVWFDDGKIGGRVAANDGQEIRVTITHAEPGGARLKAEKGINFPDTDLKIDALTDKDLKDLEDVVPIVDMVALSFLRRPEDVLALEDELTRLDGQHLGVVLKIENRQAFENLPHILLTALRSPPVGVMVARGDLAVEVGFERLSEVQEEILWICEAAHVPVIWATQILEGLAKKGAPSRAEVTDAAMSQRAECAMLNKGPHIEETTRFLSGILSRMGAHSRKRRATLRRLSIADSI
jgi:pyruvate kinase